MISNVLIASDNLLVLDQDITHFRVELGSVGLLKLKDACIAEVNNTMWNYLVTIGLPPASMSGVRPAPLREVPQRRPDRTILLPAKQDDKYSVFS